MSCLSRPLLRAPIKILLRQCCKVLVYGATADDIGQRRRQHARVAIGMLGSIYLHPDIWLAESLQKEYSGMRVLSAEDIGAHLPPPSHAGNTGACVTGLHQHWGVVAQRE